MNGDLEICCDERDSGAMAAAAAAAATAAAATVAAAEAVAAGGCRRRRRRPGPGRVESALLAEERGLLSELGPAELLLLLLPLALRLLLADLLFELVALGQVLNLATHNTETSVT